MADTGSRILEGRVAIVTGASRGIGQAIAERLGSAGATVILAARSLTKSDDLPGTIAATAKLITDRGGKAIAIACDVESAADRAALIDQTIARTGRLDILVNNAGRAILETAEVMSFAHCESQAGQYLMGPLDLSLRAIPHMRAQGEGWIVYLGSAQATAPVVAPPYRKSGMAFYGALKAAIHRLTAGFAIDLFEHNISVNTLSPVSTVMTPGVDALKVITPENMHRVEPVEHIAEAALALVSAKPKDLTGQIAYSYKFLDGIGRSTRSLDGLSVMHPR